MKCKISWVDKLRKPTPDNNTATHLVRLVGYDSDNKNAIGGNIHHDTSEWFPCCEAHMKQFNDEHLYTHHWESKPID